MDEEFLRGYATGEVTILNWIQVTGLKNTLKHTLYLLENWEPEDQFDEGYAANLADFFDRHNQEHIELDQRPRIGVGI